MQRRIKLVPTLHQFLNKAAKTRCKSLISVNPGYSDVPDISQEFDGFNKILATLGLDEGGLY